MELNILASSSVAKSFLVENVVLFPLSQPFALRGRGGGPN
jgi:hypothetical protein